MTIEPLQPESRSIDGDDWDSYWDDCGDVARGNPVNDYRRRLIRRLIGLPQGGAGARVLDIGSGQGELVLFLSDQYPKAEVRGIEYSHEGVRRSQESAAVRGSKATFRQRDLLLPRVLESDEAGWATHAVCSEVLEHVDRPDVLLENASQYLGPGCRLVITVPSGPMSEFDRHIGHRRHFQPDDLRELLEGSHLTVHRIARAGFPFYDLYRLAVVARGARAINDAASAPGRQSRATRLAFGIFKVLMRADIHSSPWGWQLTAVAERR